MTFRWQASRRNRTPSDRSTSNLSPLGTRTFPRGRSNCHNVPSGTVASRISYLQSLANTSVASPPTPTGTRRRETSRTGFGRRINGRFAQPASRNKNPSEDEYSQVRHSFLGLSNPRTNHEEEHARARSFKDQQTTNAHLVKSSEVLKARSKSPAETYLFSDESADHSADTSRRDLGREQKMINSDNSLITTSTMRRQSVIDLYHDYGIERPARLVSSREPSRMDDTPKPPKPQWTCHNCSWINNSSVRNCWRCDMPADDDEMMDGSDGAGASKMEKTSRKSRGKPMMDPQTPTASKAPQLLRKKSTPPTKFPSFDAKVETVVNKGSRGSSPTSRLVSKEMGQNPRVVSQHLAKQQITRENPGQPISAPKLTPSRAQMRKVQESPFIKADPGSVVRSKKRPHSGSQNTHEEVECVSPSCHAAYGGHKPHRHTITCSYNMRHLREHSDKEYTADISNVEEATASCQSFAIASEADSHIFHSAPEFRSDVSQPVKGVLAKQPIALIPAIHPEDPSRANTVVPPKPLVRKKSSLPKPLVPPKTIAMKTFQPTRGQVQNSNYAVPVEGPLKSTLEDASLSDATAGQSNRLTSFSTTRLQSIQTGIMTPNRLVLSQQDCQNKGPAPPRRRSYLDGDAPATSRDATPSSKKTIKKFTSVFQMRDEASVPLLTKRLLEHQDELRSRGTKSEGSPPPPPPPIQQPQNVTPKKLEDSSEKCVTLPNQKKKLRSKAGSGIGATNNMDGSLENQRLSEDTDCGQAIENDHGIEWRNEDSVPVRDEEMHECIWRRLFLEEEGGRGGFDGNGNGNQIETDGGRAGIRGVRLVIQLLGQEDLVLEGEF